MKKIDNLTRQRLFALYWRQPIARLRNDHDNEVGQVCNVNTRYCEQFVLEVTPLSTITDEDAIEVAKMLDPDLEGILNEAFTTEGKEFQKRLSNEFRNEFHKPFTDIDYDVVENSISPVRISRSIDFLRSRGYALPAYGYSVEELVEAGVFKIREVEQ